MSIMLNGKLVVPTIFPDKTSQVWHVNPDVSGNCVVWDFENESEVFQVLQLGELCDKSAVLVANYLPYARQDKPVDDNNCFALKTFMDIFRQYFQWIDVVDAHNPKVLLPKFFNRIPLFEVNFAINESKCDCVCFPDKGASERGYNVGNKPVVILEKTRDQQTGNITGMAIQSGKVESRVLIIDDICDGGKTFIEASKLLCANGAEEVYLYTTHGIYSKGLQVLRDAGIKRIFNYNGEVN